MIFSGILSLDSCSISKKKNFFNIVLISLDTVRYDALGYTGNTNALTPNINALSKQGTVFTRAISTNSLTTPAHSSLFTGRYPTAHGVHTNGVYALPDSEYTLAEFLRGNGFATAGFASAFPVSHRFGLSQGFDLYDDKITLPEQEQKAKFRMGAFAQRAAADVAQAVIGWIKEDVPQDHSFFLFIHFFDAHAPYSPPAQFAAHFGNSKKQRYAGEIAYVDAQLGRILSALNEAGFRDRTIYIVLSDHGESLGEHGEETHGLFIYDSTIRIPLFFAGGPILQEEIFEGQVGITDIFPTIADLLELPIPDSLHGRSLKSILLGKSSQIEDIPYYIESFLPSEAFGWSPLIGMRTSSTKFIQAPQPELYDLQKDPLELENLHHQESDNARNLKEKFSSLLNSITEAPVKARTHLSEEERAILHSLGYSGAGIDVSNLGSRADPKDRVHLFRKMEEARLKIHSGQNVDSALAELKMLEQEDPSNVTLRLTVGQTLIALDRYTEAEEHYRTLLSDYPNFYPALNELGNLSLRREAWEEAVTYYQKSLDRNPIQLELYPNLAHAFNQMNHMDDAIAVMDNALKLAPSEPTLQAARGELAMQVNDYVTAVQCFSIAYPAYSRDISFVQNYARALLLMGRASEAIPLLKSLETEALEVVDFQLLYGQCLAQSGHITEGIKRFEAVLAMKDNPSAHYFLGLCYLKLGNRDEAEGHFNQLSKDDPNFKKSCEALEAYEKGRL